MFSTVNTTVNLRTTALNHEVEAALLILSKFEGSIAPLLFAALHLFVSIGFKRDADSFY
jgi:hypothetical protein